MGDERNEKAFHKGADHGEFRNKPRPPKHPEAAAHYLHGYKVGAGSDPVALNKLKEHQQSHWGDGKGKK